MDRGRGGAAGSRALIRSRALAAGERALAAEVFGDALRLDTIRLLAAPGLKRAFVPGRQFGREWIVWPARALPDDLGAADTPLGLQATLVHELVHVWQAQRGAPMLLAKLQAGDGPAAYAYDVAGPLDWSALNIEQQAMAVEHAFRLSRGGSAPGEAGLYRGALPFGGMDRP